MYDVAKLQTFVNAVFAAAITLHSTAAVAAGTSTWLDQATAAQIGVLGKYAPATQNTIFSPNTPTVGVGTPVFPWNTAQVISLRTAIPRGRASNGRVYYPMIAGSIQSDTGRMSATAITNRLNAFKTFFDACNTAANAHTLNMRLMVASNVGGGAAAWVTSIRSDYRMDSIERRENDTPSVYQTVTLS